MALLDKAFTAFEEDDATASADSEVAIISSGPVQLSMSANSAYHAVHRLEGGSAKVQVVGTVLRIKNLHDRAINVKVVQL